ncbi:MAG: hypothetical protein IKG27_02030 [Bacilli bacterium]|nr:hypothetical protein [Bacilli bacterium]
MKKYVKFIFIFIFLMIVGIYNGSALSDSVHVPNYENYRYIMETESFANGSNRPVIFTIGGTDYFCSHLHLTEPWDRNCSKMSLNDSNPGDGHWSHPMAAAIGKLVQYVSEHKTDENLYYFEIATNQFIKNKGEGDNDNSTNGAGPTSTYDNFMDLMNTEYNRVKNFAAPTITMTAFTLSNNNYTSTITVSGCESCEVAVSPSNKGTLSHTSGSNGNGSYTLTVPASGITAGAKTTFTVTATDTLTARIARNYNCGENVQTITPLGTEGYSTSKNASATKDIERSKIIFNKKAADTNEVLTGGSFEFTKNNTVVETITVGNKTYQDLAFGTYCMEEKEAPEGYVNAKEKKCVTLSSSNLNATITIFDDLTSIKIKKIDENTKEALEGAKLVIVDEDGEVVSTINDEECSWTSDDDYVSFFGIPVGTYYIKELEAPDGYELMQNQVEFTINEDGSVVTSKEEDLSDDSIVIVKNKLTKVDISKQDATTGKELPGAKLQILDADGNVVEEWTSTDTPHRVEGLKAGHYYLKETIAPAGYEKTETTVEFVIYSDGSTKEVVMKNEPIKVKVPSTAKNISLILAAGGIIFVVVAGTIFLYQEGIIKSSKNKK